jgi:hypothetical protein
MDKITPHWADGLTRHCHIDSHFGSFRDVYQQFDADAVADRIAAAGFQTATFFAKCWAGYSYYPTQIGTPHPGLACDFTGGLAGALKERGLRRLVYFNLGQERRLQRQHPEWIVNRDPSGTMPDGQGLDVASMCQRSPYLDASGIPQMLEIIERFDVDGFFIDIFMHQTLAGICYCPSCADGFRRDTGLELPRKDSDASAFAYRRWANATLAAVVDRTHRALTAHKADVLLLINWGYMARFPVTPPPYIRQLTWDTPVPKVGNFAWNFSFEARYLASLEDVTWSVMNTRGNTWMEYSLREPEALLQECATTTAAGGGTYLADIGHPSGQLEPAVYDLFSMVNRRSVELSPWTRNVEPVPDVLVLHSADSVWSKTPCQPCPGWTPSPGYYSVCGAHKGLTEAHVQTVICNSDRLPELLGEAKALVLADQRILSDREADAIRRFVDDGGGLLAFAGSGVRDVDNNPLQDFALADVFGVHSAGMTPFATSYLRIPADAGIVGVPGMDVQVVGPSVRVTTAGARMLYEYVPPYEDLPGVAPYEDMPAGTPPPALTADGPGVTVHQYGKGRVVYCAVDLCAGLFTEANPVLRRLIINLLDRVHPVSRRSIVVDNAPLNVEVFYNRRGNDRFVHLVNYGGDKRETGTPQTQDLRPHSDIGIALALAGPATVCGVPGETPVEAQYTEGQLRFRAFLVGAHAVYRVSPV